MRLKSLDYGNLCALSMGLRFEIDKLFPITIHVTIVDYIIDVPTDVSRHASLIDSTSCFELPQVSVLVK